LNVILIFGKRKKSQWATSGVYGGWGTTAMLFVVRSRWTDSAVWAGALSWWIATSHWQHAK
jgi:hypothetical protein